METTTKLSKKIAESSILIAFSVILFFIALVKLPYGGEITLASMFPIVIIAYRHGTGFGLLSGLVYGIICQLLSISVLSFVTGWVSVVAVIVLDYLLAFSLIGLAGLVRKIKNQTKAMIIGTLIGIFARYICHVISGSTVWAGLSIPTGQAFLYSIIYNATYILPETIVTLIVCIYISTFFDFGSEKISVRKNEFKNKLPVFVGTTLAAGYLIFVLLQIFALLQNAETGEFDFTGIFNVNWILIGIVTISVIVAYAIFFVIYKCVTSQKGKTNE